MTKQETKKLSKVLDDLTDCIYDGYDFNVKDLIKYISARETPVSRFFEDADACLGGKLRWLKYETCEAALKAAVREADVDALEWFLWNTVNKGVDTYTDPNAVVEEVYDETGTIRPAKDFIAFIPKKFRTATVAKKGAKKSTKKAAKKAVKRGSSKKR